MLTVAACCLAVGGIVQWLSGSRFAMGFTGIGVAVCLAASLPPLWLRSILVKPEVATFLPILTMCWRSGVVLMPIVVAAATKWANLYSFSLTLLGCYFPFLVLESALSIRRIRSESGPPRQHVQHHPPH